MERPRLGDPSLSLSLSLPPAPVPIRDTNKRADGEAGSECDIADGGGSDLPRSTVVSGKAASQI